MHETLTPRSQALSHCRLLQAVKALEASLAFGRGSAAGLPPLARALGTGGAVALALQTLLAVFDAGRFSDPEADISLDQASAGF